LTNLCMALPGINYAPGASYTVHALSLARALSRYYDISFLFRSLLAPFETAYPVRSILTSPDVPGDLTGSARHFYLGRNLADQLRYVASLRRVGEMMLGCDIVVERHWIYGGALAAGASRAGMVAGFVLEGEFSARKPATMRGKMGGLIRKAAMRRARAAGFREADFVIAETEQAARMARGRTRLVRTVGCGIDLSIFRPCDRTEARARLGIAQDAIVLTYVGALNGSIQGPEQVIEGLARAGNPAIELHVIGRGNLAAALDARARALGVAAAFHGFKPQSEAAVYIAAADLCLAPYKRHQYRNGVLTSASCKVPEYLGSGRPVLAIPCERMNFLTGGGRYGYLVDDDPVSYEGFFTRFPDRAELRSKEAQLQHDLAAGRLRDAGIVQTWDDNAARYHELIEDAMEMRQGRMRAVSGSALEKGTPVGHSHV